MSKLSKWIRANCPGTVTDGATFLQTRVFPTDFYRRVARTHRLAGRPRKVVSGPFQGMRYLPWSADKGFLPRILGVYERELHDSVEHLIQTRPDAVVVAGAGEGYYAVGLALRLTQAQVYAYDAHKWARHLLHRMAVKNAVLDRVHVGGYCEPGDIQNRLASSRRPALVCDVEGYEMTLLDPAAAPVLARTTMLVELHDRPGLPIKETLRERFSGTHDIEQFDLQPRTLTELPAELCLPEEDALWAVNEDHLRGRHQEWFYLKPRSLN